jgi:tetratricopeptide (TPR) repeat protein
MGELLKKAIYEMKDARKTYDDSSISYHLAKTYELSGDVDNAIQEAVRSYNQIPSDETKKILIFLYKKKGDIYLGQNIKEEAIKYYTKSVKLNGVNVTNEDIADYEFLRSLIPDNLLVRYCLAKLYMRESLWDKTVPELEHIRKVGISNDDITGKLIYAYYNLGRKYYNDKKFKEAEGYLNLTIGLDSINRFGYSASAISILSSIYEEINRIDKAVETFMKLEESDTQKGQGYYQLGRLFNRKSNPQKAIEYFEKYLPFRPISDADIFITLGNLYELVGNIDKAVNNYIRLEDINSHRGNGHYYIGLLYEKKGRLVDALKEFEYSLEIMPTNSNILLKIGELYENIGNNRKALEIYKKAIAIDPIKEIELNHAIARCYEKIGERVMALSILKRIEN